MGIATRLARHAVPIVVGTIGILLLAGIATAAVLSPGTLGITAARISDTTPLGGALTAGLSELDTDHDGLSDALENYVYGTDPDNWNSAGLGIPDGWLVQFGYDPLDPLTKDARGRAPPAAKLPAAYASGYPIAYTPPLSDYYAYGKPADYRPGVDDPWWRKGDFADPIAADQTGTGIPTGWLLYHGVSLRDIQADRIAPGSTGNLTIKQAFEADTDPLKLDSDGDGLDDWTEIEITRTHPGKFSTAGIGIADGWLLRYQLNPFDPHVATQDPDRDGLTNYEEFQVSLQTFQSAVNESGISALYTRGLNPLDWQTAQTGIPDGWYVRYGLSPFGADVERLIGRASDFPEYRTYVPEGEAPLPDITFTVRGAYEYARPDDWNESTKGVWWGGTNPVTLDSDGDGLPDPIEIRGWYANVTFDTGPEAKPRVYRATSNPLEPDSDGDGLTDLEEYRGRTDCGTTTERVFSPTDPRNRDTAFSQVSDFEKVCGIVRGEAKYDVGAKGNAPGLDPTKADSAGDHVKDGVRVEYWHARADTLRANPRYPFNGSAYKTVFDWTEKYARFNALSKDQTIAQFRPDGDVDGDGIINVADADPSGGLYVEKFGAPTDAKTKVFFLGGPQIDPTAYRLTEFASPVPHSATDPANPDTDGDTLPDSWEIRYGRFDPTRGIWDLDPSKADSDGDGINDDKANNDDDTVTWYSFERRGSSFERTSHAFVFTNELEFLAGTDPNEVSSSGDNVPDGWKAFWGSRITSATYPNLVGARDASLGGVALDAIQEIEAALSSSSISTSTDLRNVGTKSTGYVRFVSVSACGVDISSQFKLGERLADVNPCYVGTNLDNQPIKIARIYGEKKLTFADEARLRTNPFMADTDGDGAPDAYEAYFALRTPAGTLYPDPAADDRARDPDGDGLGIDGECGSTDGKQCGYESFLVGDTRVGAGADPNAADTDGDGIQDGIESGALINPLDASDVESFARADKDSDQDGLPDFIELTGKDSKSFFGESIRTNPKDPDSDGDGLLDGENVNLNPLTQAALIAEWKARGIAHGDEANGTVSFYGERSLGQSFGVRPDRLDSRNVGVPDGWLAYYRLDTTRSVDASSYTRNRPVWWSEPLHGVWWWGDAPGVPASEDADGDGLNDANGEDPFPAISRLNRIVAGNVTITDPLKVEAYVKAGADAQTQRIRAQSMGDGSGDPAAARSAALNLVDPATNVLLRNMRACVAIVDVDAPTTLDKGVLFNVTGRVILNERANGACASGGGALLEPEQGLANRTVLVSVFGPGGARVVGAGFTNATGGFTARVNITENQVFEIPAPGLTLLGRVEGIASTRFDPTLLATGSSTGSEPNRLVAWVYNTSTTAAPGDATHAPHLARIADRNGVVSQLSVNATRFAVSADLPVTVRASTRLEFEIPDAALNGGKVEGSIRLADASGAPLLDKTVIVRWEGAPTPLELRNLTTDRNGRVNLTRVGVPVGVGSPDTYALRASFTSLDPNLLSSESTLPIQVRDPTTLDARADQTSAIVGETVSVTGDLRTRALTLSDGSQRAALSVGGATITLALGGVEESATADATGRFLVRIVVPGSIAAGAQKLEVKFPGSATAAATTLELPLSVKRTAGVIGLNKLEGPRTIDVTLRGKLVDNEGQGFPGTLEVQSDKAGLLARGVAGNDGAFTIFVPLRALELGSQAIRVSFPGDAAHASAENFTQARVTSTTRLEITEIPAVTIRGETFAIRTRLSDDSGKPIQGQPVAGFWRGDRLEVIVSDADGIVTFLVPTNLTERPSIASVGVEFTPTANSIYQPATASALVRVVAGVTLALDDASVARGPISISGRLIDDENRPLPGVPVAISFDGISIGEARTSRNGTFELLHVLPTDASLGAHRVSARFIGTQTLANVTQNATWHIRSPLVVTLTTVGPFIRGEAAPLHARITDDQGASVDAPIRIGLGNRDIGPQTSVKGALQASFTVPADIARGPTVLHLTSPQTDKYEAYVKDLPIVIKIRPTIDIELPAVAVRGFAVGGTVTLKDDKGEPLRNTSFAYIVGSGKGAVVDATNSEGKGSLAAVAPISGAGTVSLTVRGGSDVVAAQYNANTMKVVGPATPIGYAVLIIGAILLLVLIVLVIAVILLRRRQLQEAREILDEAIRDLLAGNEYAGTIFLAYRRFAAFLARHGFAEKASDTPREFALGVRKALPIGAVPLRALIGLFEEARYSDHPIGSIERDRAVESLATVRNELNKLLGEKKVTA